MCGPSLSSWAPPPSTASTSTCASSRESTAVARDSPGARSWVVVVSWLTTMAGFGSLLVAHHHGIFTLGLLLSVGSTASLIAALFVLPVLIGLFAEPSIPR